MEGLHLRGGSCCGDARFQTNDRNAAAGARGFVVAQREPKAVAGPPTESRGHHAHDLVNLIIQAKLLSEGVRILIEKDFMCIDGASDESQDDAYPHPLLGAACAPTTPA